MEVICIDVSMAGLEGGHPRVYTDVFPSITAREYKEPRMIMEVRQIGNCMVTGKRENPNQGRVYDSSGLCPTITNMQGGGRQPMVIEAQAIRMVRTEEGKKLRKQYEQHEVEHGFNEHREMELRTDGVSNTLSTVQKDNYICEKSIVAMRGRNPENPSDRTVGAPTEQRLEPNSQGICNTITSVQKDNLVMEKLVDMYNGKVRGDELCGTITANGNTSSTHCGTFGVVETVKIKQATKEGYIECKIGGGGRLEFP